MLSVTDIFNKTNAKRLGYWVIRNRSRTFLLIFMFSTLFYRCTKRDDKGPKWDGKISAIFYKLQKNGSMEFVANNQKINIVLPGFAVAKLHEDESDDEAKCENQVFLYTESNMNQILNGKDIYIKFIDNAKNADIINTVNPGMNGYILFDKSNIIDELKKLSVLCDLKEISKSKSSQCNWCDIRNRAGLRIL